MNDRLSDSLLKFVESRAASRVHLRPDEPTFNFVTRVDWLTGGVNRRQVVEHLFGSVKTKVERPMHAGFEHFAHRLAANELAGRELAQAHTMLGFFRPFAVPSQYERALDIVCGASAKGLFELVGAGKPVAFRDSPACCLECVAADARNHEPPHYRRAHLVSASLVCSEHGTPLTTSCSTCGAQLRFTDLPSMTCRSCGASMRPGQLPAEPINLSVALNLAKVIQSSLDGSLVATDKAIRLAVLREHASATIKSRSGIVGDNLSRHLIRCYGRSFLQALGLVPDAAPALGWPALMIHGRLLPADPVANCLLIAALFESVGDYNEAVSVTQRACVLPEDRHRLLYGSQQITASILQDTLGPVRLADVAKRHNLNVQVLNRWVAAYPGLSGRRMRSAVRLQVQRCKRKILDHLRDHPGASGRQAARSVRSEIAYVFRHDKMWLDQNLPAALDLTGANAAQAVRPPIAKDSELAAALRKIVERELGMLGRPRRLTSQRVLHLSGLGALSDEERSSFTETSRLLDELSESVSEYYRRCLRWAAKDLVRCRGRCDHLVELFVHSGVSVEYVRELEAYATALVEKAQLPGDLPLPTLRRSAGRYRSMPDPR